MLCLGNPVNDRLFSLLNSVKYDSSLISFSAFWQVNSFFFLKKKFCELFILCILSFFHVFWILCLCSYIFWPDSILHKYSVEGYIPNRRWNGKTLWTRSGSENIHLNPGSPRPRRRIKENQMDLLQPHFKTHRGMMVKLGMSSGPFQAILFTVITWNPE